MDLPYLLNELHVFVSNGSSTSQIRDLCNIIIDEARLRGNHRVVRGCSSIVKRIDGDYAARFDYTVALREIRAMIRAV